MEWAKPDALNQWNQYQPLALQWKNYYYLASFTIMMEIWLLLGSFYHYHETITIVIIFTNTKTIIIAINIALELYFYHGTL